MNELKEIFRRKDDKEKSDDDKRESINDRLLSITTSQNVIYNQLEKISRFIWGEENTKNQGLTGDLDDIRRAIKNLEQDVLPDRLGKGGLMKRVEFLEKREETTDKIIDYRFKYRMALIGLIGTFISGLIVYRNEIIGMLKPNKPSVIDTERKKSNLREMTILTQRIGTSDIQILPTSPENIRFRMLIPPSSNRRMEIGYKRTNSPRGLVSLKLKVPVIPIMVLTKESWEFLQSTIWALKSLQTQLKIPTVTNYCQFQFWWYLENMRYDNHNGLKLLCDALEKGVLLKMTDISSHGSEESNTPQKTLTSLLNTPTEPPEKDFSARQFLILLAINLLFLIFVYFKLDHVDDKVDTVEQKQEIVKREIVETTESKINSQTQQLDKKFQDALTEEHLRTNDSLYLLSQRIVSCANQITKLWKTVRGLSEDVEALKLVNQAEIHEPSQPVEQKVEIIDGEPPAEFKKD